MRREDTKDVKPGSIIHVAPTSDLDTANHLGVVVEKLSWGVKAWFPNFLGLYSIAWSNCEATGGRARWDQTGTELPPPEEPLRHHP